MSFYLGGIDLGANHIHCILADQQGQEIDRISLTPEENGLEEAVTAIGDFYDSHFQAGRAVAALGFAAIGPLNPQRSHPDYGLIMDFPKAGWEGANLVKPLQERLMIPVLFNTDVNAAALAENILGAARGLDNFVYLTIGTGIGAAVYANGSLVLGTSHSEAGHIPMHHEPDDKEFTGSCPFHGACFEGLASGNAMEVRYGKKPHEITDPAAWDLEARYIAAGISSLMYILSPERIILGGGIIKHFANISIIRDYLDEKLNNYLLCANCTDEFGKSFLVRSPLGDSAVMKGAIAMAGIHMGLGKGFLDV